jgi:hypothetical protein
MQPTYVTWKQAKLLKEKGFDVECTRFYVKPNSKIFGIDEHGRYYPIKNKPKELWIVGNCVALNITNVLLAPEQWQVVEWASLVHNIDIEARPVRYAGDIKTSHYQPYINGCIVNLKKFSTKQEALSEAINEFLKMI